MAKTAFPTTAGSRVLDCLSSCFADVPELARDAKRAQKKAARPCCQRRRVPLSYSHRRMSRQSVATPDGGMAHAGPLHDRECVMTTSTDAVGIVAFVGFPRAIGVRAQHLLRHCGFIVTEIAREPEPLRVLQARVRLDVIVLDARSIAQSDAAEPALVEVLSCAEPTPERDGAPVPIIVLGSGRAPAWVRTVCHRVGAHFVSTPAGGPNYTELARMLRDLRGFDGNCCSPTIALRTGAPISQR